MVKDRLATVTRATAAASFIVLLSVSCSGSVNFSIGGKGADEAALELLDGELTDSVGLGALESVCDDVSDPEVGTVFGCTSSTGDGQVISWEVTVDTEDHIDVQSKNIVLAAALPDYEAAAITALYADNPLEVVIDCGEVTRVLDNNMTMVCDASTADDPDVIYDAMFTIEDVSAGGFDVEVAEEPRP
jgi:hypothetical protein